MVIRGRTRNALGRVYRRVGSNPTISAIENFCKGKKMKFDYSNNKPFIYLSYPKGKKEETFRTLEFLDSKGVAFCHADEITNKELKHIKASFAVLVFLDKDSFYDEGFRKTIDQAVRCNKNILTVYLEDIELDSWGHMQLDSAQALFKKGFESEEAFNKKLSEAAIFQNMSVTKEQKQFQKVRGISMVTIPIVAITLIFFTIVNPLLIAPTKAMKDELGLAGLSNSELQNLEILAISGDRVFTGEVNNVHAFYDNNNKSKIRCEVIDWYNCVVDSTTVKRGNIVDVSDLAKLKNLKTLCISAQKITDISPLFELENLVELDVECNPITSLEGIEKLTNLKKLNICGTDIKDLTPLNKLENLECLSFEQSKATTAPSTEILSGITDLCVNNCKLPNVGKHTDYKFDMRNNNGRSIRDLSFLNDVESFDRLTASDLNLDVVNKYFENRKIKECDISNIGGLRRISMLNLTGVTERLDICWSEDLVSLEGIEKFDNLSVISIKHCNNIRDLSPLNSLEKPKEIVVSSDMTEQYKAQVHNDKLRMKIED